MSASVQCLDIAFGDFENEGGVLQLLRRDCNAVQIYWERPVLNVEDCDATSGPAPEQLSTITRDNSGDASAGHAVPRSGPAPVWTGSEWSAVTHYSPPDSVAVASAGAAPGSYGVVIDPSRGSPAAHDGNSESVIGASPAQDVPVSKITDTYIHHIPGGNNLNMTQLNQAAQEPYIMMPHHVTMAHVHVTQALTSSYNAMYKGTEMSPSQPIIPQQAYPQNIHPYGGDQHAMMQAYPQHDNYRHNDFRKMDNYRSSDGSQSMIDMKPDQYRGAYEDQFGPNQGSMARSTSKLYEKTYERRNKKKRPRDYYEKLSQEAQMYMGRYGNQIDNYQEMMGGGNLRNHMPFGNGQPGILGMPPPNMMNFTGYLPDTSVPPPGMMPVDINNLHHLNMQGFKQNPNIQMQGNNHPSIQTLYTHNNHMLRPRFTEPSAVDMHHPVSSEVMQRSDVTAGQYPGVPMTQDNSTGLNNPPRVVPTAPPLPNEEVGCQNNVTTTSIGDVNYGGAHIDSKPLGPGHYGVNEPVNMPDISQQSTNYQRVPTGNDANMVDGQPSDFMFGRSNLPTDVRTETYASTDMDSASQRKFNELVPENVSQQNDPTNFTNNSVGVVATDPNAGQFEVSGSQLIESSVINEEKSSPDSDFDKELSFLGEPLPSVDLSPSTVKIDRDVHKKTAEDFFAKVTNSDKTRKVTKRAAEQVENVLSSGSGVRSPPESLKEASPAGQENTERAAPSKTPELIDSGKAADAADLQTARVSNTESTSAVPQNQVNTNSSAIPVQAQSAPPKPKASSWASLFKKDGTTSNSIVVYNYDAPSTSCVVLDSGRPGSLEKDLTKENLPQTVPTEEDKAAKALGEFLLEYKLNHKSVSLQPRGLVNRANWCYVNATLQALLACPPFYHMLKSLPAVRFSDGAPSSTPVMDSLVQFVSEFHTMAPLKGQDRGSGNKGNKMPVDLPQGPPFEPTYVFKMLQIIQYDAAFKQGRQEDAEEFLSCLLNGLHEEMVAATKFASTENGVDVNKPNGDVASQTSGMSLEEEEEEYEEETSVEEEDSQWEQVGPKNKSVITRAANFQKSPAWEIFGGQIRSSLQKMGLKETATLQPFFTLQLDIQNDKVHTLKDALDALVSKEAIQGFTCSKTKKEVEASRRITLEELPAILVLHLKCMVYDSKSGGIQKMFKKVDFDVNLDINKDLLSPSARSRYSANQRQYKLLAVVSHHGSRAVGGHYTTDYFHPGLNGWVQADDGNIKLVSLNSVLRFVPSRVPYLILYRRADLI